MQPKFNELVKQADGSHDLDLILLESYIDKKSNEVGKCTEVFKENKVVVRCLTCTDVPNVV